jgi:hypothetical protein
MGKIPKTYAIVLLFCVCFLNFFIVINSVEAEDIRDLSVKLNVPIAGLEGFDPIIEGECLGKTYQKSSDTKVTCLYVPWIAQYINALYKYSVILGSVIAVTTIIVGGVMYMLGGINVGLQKKAKTMIGSAILGLILLLGSYAVLTIVNPDLVRLKAISLEKIKEKAVLEPPELCREIGEDPVYKKYFKVADWKDADPCNTPFEVTLNSSSNADIKFEEGTTCVADKCEEGKLCIKNVGVSNNYECTDAYVAGQIKPISSKKGAEEFYIMEIKLFKVGSGSLIPMGSTFSTVSRQRSTNNYTYAIAKKDGDPAINDNDKYFLYLKMHENYGDNDMYYADKNGKVISVPTSNSTPRCWRYVESSERVGNTIIRAHAIGGCTFITGADVKRAVAVNIDLEDFVTYWEQLEKAENWVDGAFNLAVGGIVDPTPWHPFNDLDVGKKGGDIVEYHKNLNANTLNEKY